MHAQHRPQIPSALAGLLALALLALSAPACGSSDSNASPTPTPTPTSTATPTAAPTATPTAAAPTLTHGPQSAGEACTQHADCAASLFCAPAGTCFAGSIGEGECKANADCPAGHICDPLFTRCEAGECGADADCDPPHCDRNGVRSGTPYSCVECESDSDCTDGDCREGTCVF